MNSRGNIKINFQLSLLNDKAKISDSELKFYQRMEKIRKKTKKIFSRLFQMIFYTFKIIKKFQTIIIKKMDKNMESFSDLEAVTDKLGNI